MAEEQYANPLEQFMLDMSVKLRDVEEKQNIIKDRVLLIGENLIAEKEETEKELIAVKSGIAKLADEIKKIRLAVERIIDDMNNLVRKNEFEVLQRQFQMFQPLNLARIEDVEAMISLALKKQK